MQLLLLTAVTSAAFNLVCSGTITTNSLYDHDKTEPYSYTYRIDLDKKKFCEGNCGAIQDIYEVQPAYIKLRAPKDVDTIDNKEFEDGSIDRQSGRHQLLMESGREASIMIMKWDGQCRKEPFTGFPKIETKF